MYLVDISVGSGFCSYIHILTLGLGVWRKLHGLCMSHFLVDEIKK